MPGIGKSTNAFVTLVTNQSYGTGAAVLGYKLRSFNTSAETVVMVTDDVPVETRNTLKNNWDRVINVSKLDSQDKEMLILLKRPELSVTYSKLNVWKLVEYKKVVFVDADVMPLCNVDELFKYEELSACRDIGWPDCFNSGLFVLEPSLATYDALIKYAGSEGSFDGGDQGLLNSFFSNWSHGDIKKHIPFTYNVNPNATYTYLPAYKRFAQDIKMIHFLGALKPWHYQFSQGQVIGSNLSEHTYNYLLEWHRTAVQIRASRSDVFQTEPVLPYKTSPVIEQDDVAHPDAAVSAETPKAEQDSVKDVLSHISSQIKAKDMEKNKKY